jgi:hypothetical protein
MEYQSVSQFEEAYFVPYEEEWCGYVIFIEAIEIILDFGVKSES